MRKIAKENIIYIIIPQERVHQGVIQPVAARQERRHMVIVRHPAVVRHPGAVRLGAVHLGAAHPITEITTVDLRVNLLMRMTMM
jgi:hypothetical protein